MFNLGEYEDQGNVLTNQDVDSSGDTLPDNFFVHEIIPNNECRAEIGRALFLVERSCPDALQAIMLMSNASFGVNHHENGVQIVGIQDAYLGLGSHLNIPMQEQVSELNNLDTCSIFHQNINPDTVNNIHTVPPGLKSYGNSGVSHTNQKANYGKFLGGLETWFQARVWQTSSPSVNLKKSTPSHIPMNWNDLWSISGE